MAVKLSERSFEYAKKLIDEGRCALDEMDDWSEHQPSAQQENEFTEKHGFGEYGRWHLGVDDEYAEEITVSPPPSVVTMAPWAGSRTAPH